MQPTEKVRYAKGLSLVLFSIFFSSANAVLTKLSVAYIDSYAGTFYYACFVVACTTVLIAIQGTKWSLAQVWIAFPAALMNACGLLFLFLAARNLDLPTFAFIGRLGVVFGILFGFGLLGERLSVYEILFLALATFATFAFTLADGLPKTVKTLGIVFGISFALCFSLANVFIRKSGTNTMLFVFLSNSLTVFLMLIISFYIGTDYSIRTNPQAFPILFFAALAIIVSETLYFESMNYIKYVHAVSMRSLNPIIILAVSAPFIVIELNLVKIGLGVLQIASLAILATLHNREL